MMNPCYLLDQPMHRATIRGEIRSLFVTLTSHHAPCRLLAISSPSPRIERLGELVSIYSDLCQMGTPPAVIDADELQAWRTSRSIKEAIFKTLITNGMFDNTHIRLSLTRGKKVTSGMSHAFNRYGCTLIVLAEWKPPVYDNDGGIVLVIATTRRVYHRLDFSSMVH